MYAAPRPGLGTSRIPEQLDALKAEYESLAHDVNMYKMQRDDYDRKLQAQLGELSSIQQTLYDLERNHTKIKQQYEEEIMRLRRQVELQGSSPVQPSTAPIPPPSIVAIGSAAAPSVNIPLSQQQTGRPPLPSSTDLKKAFPDPSRPNNGPSPLEKGNIGGSTQGNSSIFYAGLAPLDATKRAYPSSGSNPSAAPSLSSSPPVSSTASPPSSNTSSATAAPPPAKRNRDEAYSSGSQSSGATPNFPSLSHISNDNGNVPKQHKTEPKEVSQEGAEGDNNMHKRSSPTDRIKEEPGSSRKAGTGTEETSASGVDWIVGYNPNVQTNLSVDLLHNFDHSSVVCCVRFSNDGKCLATGCNKSAQVFDVETGEKIYAFTEDPNKEGDLYIRSVCFSPDNKYLAAGAEDKTVKVWDIEKKRLHHTFVGHELDIYSLDFSRNGNLIVSGSGDKKAKIWDIEKGECVYTLGNDEVGPHDGVTSVAFSPDGRYVAAGSLDRIVRLWDATTGYFVERFEGHLDSVYSVAFSPDGKTLASGSLDKTLRLWDIQGPRSRSRCRSTFTGHKDFVLSVAFSPDGNWLISGSKDRSVQFWDPRTAVTHMMLQGHKNSVISVAVSPTGGHFATVSGDFRARIWKM